MSDATIASPPAPPRAPDAVSLDDQIKMAQRDKLLAEVRQLRGVSPDTLSKLLIAALGIVAAVFALWLGVPQTRLELAKAQEELTERKRDLMVKTAEVQKQQALAEQTAGMIAESARKLAETETQRARAQDELTKLQAQTAEVVRALEQSAAAGARPISTELVRRASELTKPRLFVQFAGSLDLQSTINPLRSELAALGVVVPAAERIDANQSNEVRVFTRSDADMAMASQIAAATQRFFNTRGCPLRSLPVKQVTLPQGRVSPLELWLKLDCSR